MAEPVVLLVDNGSRRAAATLSLRAIAADLAEVCGRQVHPVSLQHSGDIAPDELDGTPARVLEEFLRDQLEKGRREFVAVPLFFGKSRALTAFVPQKLDLLTKEFGPFEFRMADVLSPMPEGEPLLADILADNVTHGCAVMGTEANCVIVVDHGSPLPEVTADVKEGSRDWRALACAFDRVELVYDGENPSMAWHAGSDRWRCWVSCRIPRTPSALGRRRGELHLSSRSGARLLEGDAAVSVARGIASSLRSSQ